MINTSTTPRPMTIHQSPTSVSGYVRPRIPSSEYCPLPTRATARAPAASGTGNSQPPLPDQKPFGTCATMVTTTRSAATAAAGKGPNRPSARRVPPSDSARIDTQAQKIPGLNPRLFSNQPAIPAGEPPLPTQPSFMKPCIVMTTPTEMRRTSIARSVLFTGLLLCPRGLEPQRLDLGEHGRGMVLPARRLHVDVELDLVTVRIFDVEAVRHPVIRHTDDLRARLLELVTRLAQLVVGLADLQSEVIEAEAPSLRQRRGTRADLDEQQLVMRAARGERRRWKLHPALGRDLVPAEQLAVETSRSRQILHVQDQVSELFD